MRKRWIAVAVVLWGMGGVCSFAREHAPTRQGADVLIQASGGWQWVGHQQSERSFITCYGTPIAIEAHDKIEHGASCQEARAVLHAGVQHAVSTYASLEGYGLIRLTDAYGVGKYAVGAWLGEGRKKGTVLLVNDGEIWHVLSFGVGKFNEREVLARGVPRDVLAMLLAAK